MSIKDCRKDIDMIDEQIVELLNQRFFKCIKIGLLKEKEGLMINDLSREDEIINRLSTMEVFPGMVEQLWPIIFRFSKELQKEK